MPILVFLGLIKIRELSKKYVYFILSHSLILINISLFIFLRKKKKDTSTVYFSILPEEMLCVF